jgi:hypothetical protein
LFWNTKEIGNGLIGSLNGKFGAFPQTKPDLTRRKHLMGLFSNTRGIGSGVIESLNDKLDAFPPKKPYLTRTKLSIELATQGYLELKAL